MDDSPNGVVGKTLFDEAAIAERVAELGTEISKEYQDQELLVIAVLRGSFIFAADLIRHITCELEIDFLAVSSYGSDTTSTGVVKILKDINQEIQGKEVLIVEDIIDSGTTLNHLVDYLALKQPASIKTCSLLLRQAGQVNEPPLDYYGFKITTEDFVIGYGLDVAQKFRNLPYIAIYEPDASDEQ